VPSAKGRRFGGYDGYRDAASDGKAGSLPRQHPMTADFARLLGWAVIRLWLVQNPWVEGPRENRGAACSFISIRGRAITTCLRVLAWLPSEAAAFLLVLAGRATKGVCGSMRKHADSSSAVNPPDLRKDTLTWGLGKTAYC
jgi:hypothetical protein